MKALLHAPNSATTAWTIHVTGIVILLAAGLSLEFFALAPMRQQMNRDQDRVLALEKQLRQGTKIREEFNKMRRALEEQKAKQKAFQERLPAERMDAEFLAQLHQLAKEVNLNIQDYRPGKVTERGDYSEVEVELTGEGTYESLCRFLTRLPQVPRLSSLAGLEIQAGSEKSAYPIRLNFSAYFVPMNSSATGASGT